MNYESFQMPIAHVARVLPALYSELLHPEKIL